MTTSLEKKTTRFELLLAGGGPRYAAALLIDSVGGGLLRPFLVLYGVSVLGLGLAQAGLAMSLGLLAGLVALPPLGLWLDRGARSAPVAATLFVRAAGVVVLLTGSGLAAFITASVLMGLGSLAWPPAHAALVTAVAEERVRDAALAAARSLRNAGLGAGALIATLAIGHGGDALRVLTGVTGAALLVSGVLVHTMRLSAPVRHTEPTRVTGGNPRGLILLLAANLPLAFCFSVLEVALPAVVVTQLGAAPAWSAGMFVGNTVLVIAAQVPVVLWAARWSRRTAFAASGVVLALSYLGFWGAASLGGNTGALAVGVVCVGYTLGEILYTGTGTSLVIASTPPHLLGRALVRWQLSTGIGMAAAPAVLTALFAIGPGALWPVLAAATLLSSLAVVARPAVPA